MNIKIDNNGNIFCRELIEQHPGFPIDYTNISTYNNGVDKIIAKDVYKLIHKTETSGLRLNADLFEYGKTYLISFDCKPLDDKILFIRGYSSAFNTNKIFINNICNQDKNWHKAASSNDFGGEFNKWFHYDVILTKVSRTDDNNLYIQPNRGKSATNGTVIITNICLADLTNKSLQQQAIINKNETLTPNLLWEVYEDHNKKVSIRETAAIYVNTITEVNENEEN